MSELQDNLLNIKQEKDTKILPQNIKKGITIYNITGTLEGGGSVEGVKQFNSMQEMQADPSPSDGDLATVYSDSTEPLTQDMLPIAKVQLPNTVTFSTSITSTHNLYGGPSSQMGCNLEIDLTPSGCRVWNQDEQRDFANYTSADGITYTKINGGNEIDFTTTRLGELGVLYLSDSDCLEFLQVGSSSYSGLYKYGTYKTDDFRAYDLANCVYDPVQSKIIEVPEMPNRISHTAIQEVLNLIDEAEGKENHNAYGTICIDKNFDNLLIGVVDNNGTFVQAVIALFNNKLYLCRSNSSGVSMRLFNYNLNTKVFSELSLPQETLDFQYYNSAYTGYRLDVYAILQGSYNDYQRQRLDGVAYYTDNSQPPVYYGNYYPIYYYEDKYAPAPTQLSATQETVYEGIFYGKNGVQEGNLSNTNNLNIPEVRNRANLYSDLSYLELNENITGLAFLFNGNTDICNIPMINTYNIKTMYGMFNGCINLKEVCNFQCENVTNIIAMFNGCTNLSTNALSNIANSLPYANQVNTTTVYTTGISANRFGDYDKDVLYNKGYLDCDRNTTGWDTQYNINGTLYSRGDDFDRYGTALKNLIPNIAGSVNISNVGIDNGILLNTYNLFCYKSATSINMNVNTSNVTNMASMFSNCRNLTSVSNFNTSKVTNMSSMFYSSNNLTSVPNFNTSNVTNMYYMFGRCYSLTTVPNFNTNNVTNMAHIFSACNKLTLIPNFNTSNATDMSSMFNNCQNLTTISNFDTSNVTSMWNMFYNCQNLKTVPQFNTSKVRDVTNMFYHCNNLSDASIQNIINMCLNSVSTYKNLSKDNWFSPFYGSNITNSRYQNRWSELTAAGWNY